MCRAFWLLAAAAFGPEHISTTLSRRTHVSHSPNGLFGIFVLKLNPAVLLGALTGAMTSTPALTAVQEAAKSSIPALGYAGTYAFANVMLTVAGTIIMTL